MPDTENPFAARSPLLLALFRAYLHVLFWRRFSAVRVAAASRVEQHTGRPLVIYTNHPSWWDPALFMLVSPKLFANRLGFGPMDQAQLQRYGLFRRFGVFGVEPGPRGAARFLRICRQALAEPRAAMWITAEGAFRDTRPRPIVLRPGIAHLARHVPHAVFIPVAIEYVFWNESQPEALFRVGAPVVVPDGGPAEAHAALTQALTETMDALATDSAARNPAAFQTLLNGTAGTGVVYDSWRRLRAAAGGRRISVRHEAEPR